MNRFHILNVGPIVRSDKICHFAKHQILQLNDFFMIAFTRRPFMLDCPVSLLDHQRSLFLQGYMMLDCHIQLAF